jgi:hypothetical protein
MTKRPRGKMTRLYYNHRNPSGMKQNCSSCRYSHTDFVSQAEKLLRHNTNIGVLAAATTIRASFAGLSSKLRAASSNF